MIPDEIRHRLIHEVVIDLVPKVERYGFSMAAIYKWHSLQRKGHFLTSKECNDLVEPTFDSIVFMGALYEAVNE